jgi:CheY-like chemotaxis protein
MRILLVDNDARRINMFNDVLGDEHDIDTCLDVDDGIDAIHSVKYDCIFLDHELGMEPSNKDPYSDCIGYDVVRAIKDSENAYTPTVIHSVDVQWSEKISCLLPNAVRIPFHELSQNIVEAIPRILNRQ